MPILLLFLHSAAVALDHAATTYCLPCCRAISHIVFDQEKVRIDVGHLVPWFAWREDILHRSFDCWRFTRQGYWKGFRASYPMVVSQTHVRAAAQCGKRKQDLAEKRTLCERLCLFLALLRGLAISYF
jgi:hypothetical protein